MSSFGISPFPVWDNVTGASSAVELEWTFLSTSEHELGARGLGSGVYALGSDTAWDAARHDLKVHCRLSLLPPRERLFGPAGLVCGTARLGVTLEWKSATSAVRGFGSVVQLSQEGFDASSPLDLELLIPPGSLRGAVEVTASLFVATAGRPTDKESHLANIEGSRLGQLGERIELIVDGDGSLFPITEERGLPEDALWEFRSSWDDPLVDEFDPEYLSLVLNSGHSDFEQLKGDRSRPYQTALFRQVLASWVALLLIKLKFEDPEVWTGIDIDDISKQMPGSIAAAARYLVSRGELETESPEALMASCQRWINSLVQPEEARR